MAEVEKAIIELRGVCLRDGVAAAAPSTAGLLNVSVREGETLSLGLRGPSRALFCDLVLGTTTAEQGEVRVFGRDPARNPVHVRQRLGYLPSQKRDPQDRSTVRDVLILHRWAYSTWDKALAATLLGLLRHTGRQRLASLTPEQLGRVKLCCALAHRPQLVLFDGPPSAAAELLDAARVHLPPTTAIVIVAAEGDTFEAAQGNLPAAHVRLRFSLLSCALLSFQAVLCVSMPLPTWLVFWSLACLQLSIPDFQFLRRFHLLPLLRWWRHRWSVLGACGLLATLAGETSSTALVRSATVVRSEPSDSRARFDKLWPQIRQIKDQAAQSTDPNARAAADRDINALMEADRERAYSPSLRTAPFLWHLTWGSPPTVTAEGGEQRHTPTAYPLLPRLRLNAYDPYESPPEQPELLAAQWARLLRDQRDPFSLAKGLASPSDGVEGAIRDAPHALNYRKTRAWYGLKLWVMGLPLFVGAGASKLAARKRRPSAPLRRGAVIALGLVIFCLFLLSLPLGSIVDFYGWDSDYPWTPGKPWMALLGVFLRSAEASPWPYLALGALTSWGAYQGARALIARGSAGSTSRWGAAPAR